MWFLEAFSGVSALREEVGDLRREIRALRLEWDDFYDKGAKILRRIGRERVRLESTEETETPSETPVDSSPLALVGGGLTPRQKAIQQTILKRRAGLQ
jgi:hypothetical protein